MDKLKILVERGDHTRLERLHAKVMEAVRASGVDAEVTKGAAAGGMSVRHEPEMSIGSKRVSRPEAMTATGIAKLLRLARDGSAEEVGGHLALPFSARFRETGTKAHASGMEIGELVDDATGVRYLVAGGSLCPLFGG